MASISTTFAFMFLMIMMLVMSASARIRVDRNEGFDEEYDDQVYNYPPVRVTNPVEIGSEKLRTSLMNLGMVFILLGLAALVPTCASITSKAFPAGLFFAGVVCLVLTFSEIDRFMVGVDPALWPIWPAAVAVLFLAVASAAKGGRARSMESALVHSRPTSVLRLHPAVFLVATVCGIIIYKLNLEGETVGGISDENYYFAKSSSWYFYGMLILSTAVAAWLLSRSPETSRPMLNVRSDGTVLDASTGYVPIHARSGNGTAFAFAPAFMVIVAIGAICISILPE